MALSILLAACVLSCPTKSLAVLFVGNSHTSVNDVPGSVKALLSEQLADTTVSTEYRMAGHLEDAAKDPATLKLVGDARWDVVVLQGAMVSSSHKYTYS